MALVKNILTRSTLVLGLALGLAGGPVLAQEPANKKTGLRMKKKAKPEFESKVATELAATYSAPFEDNGPPSAEFELFLSYQFEPEQTVYLRQAVEKFFETEEGDDEMAVKDGLIGYGYTFSTEPLKTGIKLETSIPGSKKSQHEGVITATTLKLPVSKALFDGRLTLGLSPFGRVYFNEFKTAPVEDGSSGKVLPLVQYGTTGFWEVVLKEFWAFGMAGAYSRLEYEESDYTNSDDLTSDNLPTHNYLVDIYTRIQFHKNISGTLGMVQASQVEKQGGIEFVVFDEQVTQWYGSLTLSL